MLKKYLSLLFIICFSNIVIAQKHEIQIGVQTGIAIPMGQFASGYGPYVDNGYASKGYNYKVYAEYQVKNTFKVGLDYINFSNSQEEGNLRAIYNNRFSSVKTEILEYSNTQSILGSLTFRGKDAPVFIKGMIGLGVSKTGSVLAKNNIESYTEMQSTSNLNFVTGLGIGFYIPIRNKLFMEFEADYISSYARPKNYTLKDNSSNYTENWGDINYNQTVINLNIGVGIFLFRE